MVMKGKDEKHQTQSGGSKSKRKYKGVRMRSWGSWVSEIRAPNQKTRIWLGSYSTAEAAARAYDAALLCLKGSSAANLNFPLLAAPSSFAIPTTDDAAALSPKSIQRVAAAAAANSFQEEAASGATAVPITSLSPSPSSSSSASDQLDDDAAALGPSPSDHVAAWFDGIDGLQSPKYDVDLLCNGGGFFSPPAFEDFYEEGEIGLWSFC